MRTVMEAAGDHEIDTTDGVRVVERDGGWVLVLPDPAEAVTHLWAEGPDADAAQAAARRVGARWWSGPGASRRLAVTAECPGYCGVGPRIFASADG